MPSMEIRLERLTWPQVRDALDRGTTTVVIPVGAVEQHGPHLPLFTDAERGGFLAVEVARRLGNALAAPTLRLGCSEHHMAFPGTISVEKATLTALVRDVCVSLSRHGFRNLCLLPSHGGNYGPLRDGLDDFRGAVEGDCRVVAYTDLEGFLALWRRAVEETAGLGHRVGGHADVAESSEMLVLHPDLVDVESAVPGYQGDVRGDVLDRIMDRGLQAVTDNGVLGDARGLSPEIGRRCLDVVADALAEHFKRGLA